MALYGSAMPSVASTTDLWRAILGSLTSPVRSSATRPRRAEAKNTESRSRREPIATQPRQTALPEFLQNNTIELYARPSGDLAVSRADEAVSKLSGFALNAANPIPRRALSQPQGLTNSWIRPFTRPSLLDIAAGSHKPAVRALSTWSAARVGPHTRPFSSSSFPRSVLANAEERANNNPGNANMQNAFYQVLLLANMPGIVVERYQTGRFATNPATTETYNRALASINSGNTSAGQATGLGTAGIQSQAQQIQSAQGPAGSANNAAASPIPVYVMESRGSLIFRWVRLVLYFAFFTYVSLAVVTLLTETLLARKGPHGKADSEVRAEKQTTKFTDVHGCDEAKEELQEVVDFLRDPSKFSDLGAKLPRGVLLVGPPGTGKTLLARAVAGEAGVPFFYMSASEFDEIYVGVGAKRVRELFTAAKAKSPAIVFIDELDAVGSARSSKDQAYSKQTLNQLLTELDGFNQDSQIILIGATNLPGSLDKALTRPGRFDRHVNVSLPDFRGRLAILQHYAKKVKLAPDVDLEAIAARGSGKSGAELENMLNTAALRASRAKAATISRHDMDWAFDRLTMGSERKSMVVREKEKELTAYHEAGHAMVQLLHNKDRATLYKVTILPKGPSLGHTAFLPETDSYSQSAADMLVRIRVALGGKMAEELQYGIDQVTSGASSDLQAATSYAFAMVSRYGMSETLGPMEFADRYENLSSGTRALVENEVQKVLKKSYEETRKLLTDHKVELDRLAQALVQYETLDRAEVERVIRGEKLTDRPSLTRGPGSRPVPIPEGKPIPGLEGVSVPGKGGDAPPTSPQ